METITKLPALGSLLPGLGGHFAGILRSRNADGDAGGNVALIVANAPDLEDAKWGEYGKDIAGTASRFDGPGNTAAMAAAGNPLATQIQALEIDGHKDFYLPAQAELAIAAANVPELFDKADYYWSSTQHSRGYAWFVDFEHGTSFPGNKASEFRARAFRRFPLEALTA